MSTNELPLAILQLAYNLGVGLSLTYIVFYACVQLMEPVSGLQRNPFSRFLWLLGGGLAIGSILWSIQLLAREGFTVPLTGFMTAVLMVLLTAANVQGKGILRAEKARSRRVLSRQRVGAIDLVQSQTCYCETLADVTRDIAAIAETVNPVERNSRTREPALSALTTGETRHSLKPRNSTDLISQDTPESCYLYASPACLKLLGYKSDELVRHSAQDRKFFHLQYGTGIGQSHLNLLKQPESAPVSYRIHSQGGDEICFKSTATPIHYPDLGLVEEIVPVSGEMVEGRPAEEKRWESKSQFQTLIASVPGMIYQFLRRIDGSVSFPFVSSEARDIYELDPSQIQDNAAVLIDRIHPSDRASFQDSLAVSAESLQLWRWEGRFVLPSGKLKWLQAAARPALQANGNILWCGVLMDITERKQVEAILLEQSSYSGASILLSRRESLLFELANQIRNSLELDTILETAVESIRNLLQIDRCHFIWYRSHESVPDWEVVSEARNPLLKSHVGQYATAELGVLGKRLLKQQIVQVNDIETLSDRTLRQFLLSLGYTSLLSIPIQTKLGQIGTISCIHCTEVRAWDTSEVELLKAVVAQLAIAIDQADLYAQARQTAQHAQAQARELERALNQLKTTQAQLVQNAKMSSLGQLVAGIAHEINNPVNFIHGNLSYASAYIYDLLGFLRLYQEQYPNPTAAILEQAEDIDVHFLANDLPKLLHSMQQGTDRIRSIVLSLRNFSRLDEAQMKEVDLHEGLDSTLLILQHRLKLKHSHQQIQVVKEYGNLPTVKCYPGELNQVFLNIISNAIEAFEQPDGGTQEHPLPTITIRTQVLDRSDSTQKTFCPITELQPHTSKTSQSVAIQIVDNGSGMTESIKAKIFDPFFTSKPVGQGTGLGLSICYQIITERHHGVLTCTSAPGQGSEFWIEIPVIKN